jgi:hypothetical protein
MKKNQETWLPLFSGFYNTIWELDTEYYVDEDNNSVDFGRLEIDYQSWEKACCEHIIHELNLELSDFSLKMRFQSISSPSFYNFSNDSCNVILDIDEQAVSKYIYENQSAFEDYIKEKYTSYDGFWSSHSNQFKDWEEDTKKFKNYSENDHCLGALLQFICENEGLSEMDFRDSFDDYAENYIKVLPLNWSDIDIDKAFEECIEEMDLEYGDIIFDINDAKSRAELFSTDWKDELSEEIKIKLLEASKFVADEFGHYENI